MSLHRLSATALAALAIGLTAPVAFAETAPMPAPATATSLPVIHHRQIVVDGTTLHYREAGPADAPVLLLLHGFPTSGEMYRDLMIRLGDRYRVIAPDYPGFGFSGAPPRETFAYTFQHYAGLMAGLTDALGIDRYALYVMDYGAPVGFRLATARPDRVTALITQNGNAYDDGIGLFWAPIKAYWRTGRTAERNALTAGLTPEATEWQYTNGVPADRLDRVSPATWTLDQALLDRPGVREIMLDLFHDYRTNVALYPQWQAWMRERRPPTLAVWGANDEIFLFAGAQAFARDNPDAEIHRIDSGHFALESHGPEIADLVRDFLDRKVAPENR